MPPVTYRATDFVIAANRLALDVVIGSDGALPLGGTPVVQVDPDDPDGSVDRLIATVGRVDAVVAVDAAMLPLAARLGRALGLADNAPEAIAAAADKAIQRRLWAEAGVAQPGFQILRRRLRRPAHGLSLRGQAGVAQRQPWRAACR